MDPVEYSLYLSEDNPMAEKPLELSRAFDAIVTLAKTAGVRIVLVGGLARNAYVRPRMTNDIDFLVRDQEGLDRLATAAADGFQVPKDVEALAALRHRATGVEVDLMVAEYPFEWEGFDAATTHRVRRKSVLVMPIEHLCAMKVDAAGSPSRFHDFGDVAQMLAQGGANAEAVAALVRRDLPNRVPTLEAILRVVGRSRTDPPTSAKGRGKR